MRSFVLCETAADARRALRLQSTIVAVMPEAAWFLRQRDVAYFKLDDCYQETDLSEMSEAVLRTQILWREEIDDWLHQRVPTWKEADFRPVKLTLYYLKIFFDELLVRTHILARFLEQTKPDVVTFFQPRRAGPAEWHLFFQESPYSLLLPIVAQRFGTKLEPVPVKANRIPAEGYVPRSGWRALAAPIWKRLPPSVRSRLRRPGDTPGSSAIGSGAPLMCFGYGYDLTDVREEASRRQLDFLPASMFSELARRHLPVQDAVPIGAVWNDLVRHRPFWDLCRPEGFDLRSMAEPRLESWWHGAVRETWRGFQASQAALRQQPLSTMLTIPAPTPFELGLQAGARAAGVPLALFQHGGFIGNCDQIGWDVADLSLADYSFVYGPGVKSYVAERGARSPVPLASPIAIGSPRLDRMRHGIQEDRRKAIRRELCDDPNARIVLYVPTVFSGYTRQLCHDAYPDVSYFELQTDIFRIFAAHSEVKLIYKAFVSAVPNPIKTSLRSACPTARWITSPSLTELLWAVDAILIDYPSTALLEAVLTPARLVVFADEQCIRFRPEARDVLTRRGTFTSTREAFLQAIRTLLAEKDLSPVVNPDRSFEMAYGTHVGDGRSASRAIDALEEVVRTSRVR